MTYKRLTEEQKTEAEEAFQLVDKESSGAIKTKEVGIVLRSLGHNPSEEDLEKLLAGKEDKVTLNEFLEMLSAEVNDDMNAEELRVAFKVFDREGQVKAYSTYFFTILGMGVVTFSSDRSSRGQMSVSLFVCLKFV